MKKGKAKPTTVEFIYEGGVDAISVVFFSTGRTVTASRGETVTVLSNEAEELDRLADWSRVSHATPSSN